MCLILFVIALKLIKTAWQIRKSYIYFDNKSSFLRHVHKSTCSRLTWITVFKATLSNKSLHDYQCMVPHTSVRIFSQVNIRPFLVKFCWSHLPGVFLFKSSSLLRYWVTVGVIEITKSSEDCVRECLHNVCL